MNLIERRQERERAMGETLSQIATLQYQLLPIAFQCCICEVWHVRPYKRLSKLTKMPMCVACSNRT